LITVFSTYVHLIVIILRGLMANIVILYAVGVSNAV